METSGTYPDICQNANDGLSLSEDPTKTEINLKFKYVVEILAVQV